MLPQYNTDIDFVLFDALQYKLATANLLRHIVKQP